MTEEHRHREVEAASRGEEVGGEGEEVGGRVGPTKRRMQTGRGRAGEAES